MNKQNTPAITAQFIEKINAILRKNDISVSKLADQTGLGRTSIQRLLAGTLLPSRNFVRKLISVLPLSPDERFDLTELYIRLKVGEERYLSGRMIMSLLKELSISMWGIDSAPLIRDEEPLPLPKAFSDELSDSVETIYRVLSTELSKEKPRLLTSLPFVSGNLFSFILALVANSGKKVEIVHFGRVVNDMRRYHDLEAFRSAIKVAVQNNINYTPYTYSVGERVYDDNFSPYPYFLLSSDYGAVFSKDIRNCMCSDSPELRRRLEVHSDFLVSISNPLFEKYDAPDIQKMFLSGEFGADHIIEYRPEVFPFMSENTVERFLKKEHMTSKMVRSMGVGSVDKLLDEKRISSAGAVYYYFTPEGLADLVRTGKMGYISEMLFEPPDIPARKEVLENIIRHGGCRIIRSSLTQIPRDSQILIDRNRLCIAYSRENEKKMILVKDPAVVAAFEDFIVNAEEYGVLLSPEESEEQIRSMIDSM